MIIKAIHLYTYKQPFKSPIITKVKLYERESLIVEILTEIINLFMVSVMRLLRIGMMMKR